MKCPTCGTENKSTNKACFRCGRILNDSGMQPKGNANSLWYNSAEKKANPSPPPFWGNTRGKPSYEEDSDFIVLHDESSRSNAAQDLVERGAPAPDNRQKLARAGKREVNVIVPARPAPYVEASRGGRRYKVRWPRLVFATVAILAVFAGLGYGAFTLYRVSVSAASNLIAEKRGNEPLQVPKREVVRIDGETWHKITFYGNDGDMVLLDNPKRSLEIKNGKAELMLNDAGFIPDDLTEDQVTVSLEATLISQDGKETKITVDPYYIDVPLAPLKIISPQEQQDLSTYNDSMYIKIKVAPGSSRVLIGDTNVTDNISADGYASTTVKLKADSTNTIQISVVTAKFRKNVYELKVDRPVMDVPIQLDNEVKSSTEDGTVKISGTTNPGVQITTDAKLKGKIDVKDSGGFTFTAVLKRWGNNDITITATAADGRSSKLVHTVNHTPVLGNYTTHAFVLDYNYLVSAADNLIGTVYMIKGVMVQKIESDVSDYYLFNAGGPGETKLLVVEYTKEAGLKPNTYYQLFADVTGTLDNHPLLTVRFLNELPMPSGYGTAAPDSSPSPSPGSSDSVTTEASETPGKNQ